MSKIILLGIPALWKPNQHLNPLRYISEVELPDTVCMRLGLHHEARYIGALTRQWAPGAIPNDAIVVKCNSNDDDIHLDGTRGRVLGSILVNPAVVEERGGYFYSVEWSMNPGFAVFIHGSKVKKPAPSSMLQH